MKSLPLLPSEAGKHREQLGFARTSCACHDCSVHCRYVPGFLLPEDLERLAPPITTPCAIIIWAKNFLLASPGFKVVYQGTTIRIPTLVPARKEDGSCIHLTNENLCAIHAKSPYGCAFFDNHMPDQEAQRRSHVGALATMEAWKHPSLYSWLWNMLDNAGLRNVAPEVSRLRQSQHHHQTVSGLG